LLGLASIRFDPLPYRCNIIVPLCSRVSAASLRSIHSSFPTVTLPNHLTRPRSWLQWLLWAEFCYNSAYHSAVKTSPFKIVYGWEPPSFRAYTSVESKLSVVHHQLSELDEFLAETRERLEQAQYHYKLYHDRKHREVEFQVGQWVWLWLISRPLASLDVRGRSKLGPK
jgi:hypothetical protein